MMRAAPAFGGARSHIASGAELWFEKLGLRPDASPRANIPRHREPERASPNAQSRAGATGPPVIRRKERVRTMLVLSRLIACVSALLVLTAASVALAALGHPTPWQTGLQDAATPVMENIIWFHNLLLIVITLITAVVLALLVSVMVRFNERASPTPSRTTHRTSLEVAWTVIPIAILVFIAVPSFRLLFLEQTIPQADITVKATGKQWYWSYGYPDQGKFEFDSLMIQDKDLKPDQPRLLSVDNEMVVPVNKIVRVQATGSDVIHSFAVPSFGVKIDAIPGRLNETWFKATTEGIYYGQCSELCGKNHAFMPIAVRVVSENEFNGWLEEAKKKYARDNDAGPTALAARESVNAQ
jgi:cytochrome c oxidase subunit 2